MPVSVSIVDLGLGNLRSVLRAVERAGGSPRLVRRAEDVARAGRLIVPGQGAFRDCSRALGNGLGDAVRERIRAGTPYLGICLGMQALFSESEEALGAPGLGVFPGRVVRFRGDLRGPDGARLKVPHVGWNQVTPARGGAPHALLAEPAWFYFVHSFYCVPDDPRLAVGVTEYGGEFISAVARDNVLAVQFHPEKSQDAGASLVAGFLKGTA